MTGAAGTGGSPARMHAVAVTAGGRGRRYAALERKLPYICTQSLKANCARRYPSEVLAGEVYLGEWAHAQGHDRLSDLNVRRVVTIHNSPGAPPCCWRCSSVTAMYASCGPSLRVCRGRGYSSVAPFLYHSCPEGTILVALRSLAVGQSSAIDCFRQTEVWHEEAVAISW